MIRRVLTLLMVAFGVFIGFGSSAYAYTPVNDSATVSDSTVAQGGTTTVSADGYAPNSDVIITLTGNGQQVYLQTAADANGMVSERVSFGSLPAGTYMITITGQDISGNPVVKSTSVMIVSSGGSTDDATGGATGGAVSGSGSGLAMTGAGVGPQLWLGAGLVGLGAVLVALTVVRRRVVA